MLNSADRVGLQLSEFIGQGDWRLFFINRDRIRKGDVEDVQKAASEYLKPSNRTLGVFVPTRSRIAPRSRLRRTSASVVKDYKGDAAVAGGRGVRSLPANIESRTKRSKLSSGLQVAPSAEEDRGGTVVAAMTLRFGDEKSPDGQVDRCDMAGGHADARHRRSTPRPADPGRSSTASRRASASPARHAGHRLDRDDQENFPGRLRLAAEVLASPLFPDKEFEELRQRTSPRSSSRRARARRGRARLLPGVT
jgi:zinc protease